MLIGVVHLAPSLGTPGFPGVREALAALEADLEALAGMDGVLLENDNDKPHTLVVNRQQLAWLARVAAHARARVTRPLGINVQRIDWRAAFAIAAAAELDLVRLDTLVDRVRMGGEEVALDPAAVMAHCPRGVRVIADVHVKHAELIDPTSLADSTRRAVAAGADYISVTGRRTGEPPTVEDLDAAHAGVPVLIGSGLSADNASHLLPHAGGALVGTSLKDGDRISSARVRAVMSAAGQWIRQKRADGHSKS